MQGVQTEAQTIDALQQAILATINTSSGGMPHLFAALHTLGAEQVAPMGGTAALAAAAAVVGGGSGGDGGGGGGGGGGVNGGGAAAGDSADREHAQATSG